MFYTFTPTDTQVFVPDSVNAVINCIPKNTTFRRRSHLFVPLNKPRFLEKVGAGEIAADGIIWDLEDSVPQGQKAVARKAVEQIPPKPHKMEYCVRLNVDQLHLREDIAAIRDVPFDSVTIPKGESPSSVMRIMDDVGPDKRYIVTIETLLGLYAVKSIAEVLRPGLDALGFGVGDMSTELGVARIPTYESPIFQQIMGTIALASKSNQLDVFDSVSSHFTNTAVARKEASLSCDVFGFTGKKAISPSQLEAINDVFSPRIEDVERAISTLTLFLKNTSTNAHAIAGEYCGTPAYKWAISNLSRIVAQGFLVVSPSDSNHYKAEIPDNIARGESQ